MVTAKTRSQLRHAFNAINRYGLLDCAPFKPMINYPTISKLRYWIMKGWIEKRDIYILTQEGFRII